ncbi:MAG: hypothetical protein ACR2M4_04490 [Actinomycetota bacterium]
MDPEKQKPSSSKSSIALRAAVGVIGTTLVGAMIFSGLGVATGQSETPAAEKKGPLKDKIIGRGGFGQEMMGRGGPGHGPKGFGQLIHGEATAKKADGEFQTTATQMGEVTEVSASAIRVKSEDGFTREYKVEVKTKVNQDGKIQDIKKGTKVHVMATVKDGKSTAARIFDAAKMEELKEKRRAAHAERKQLRMDRMPEREKPAA